MRFTDIVKFSLAALYQQKVRTLLTTLGVVIGTFVLVLSLSVGTGVQDLIRRQFGKHDRLRIIEVSPNWTAAEKDIPTKAVAVRGTMNAAKRRRIRAALLRRWHQQNTLGPQVPLTPRRIRKLSHIDHVEAVTPFIRMHGRVIFHNQPEYIVAVAAQPDDRRVQHRIVAGKPFTAANDRAVLLNEVLLYVWGMVDDDQVQGVLGKKVRLELSGGQSPNLLLALLNPGEHKMTLAQEKVLNKVVKQLPAALQHLEMAPGERATLRKLLRPLPHGPGTRPGEVVAMDLTIAGVLRNPSDASLRNFWDYPTLDNEIILPMQTAQDLYFRMPARVPSGFDRATVTVDSEEHVQEVAEKIKDMGLSYFALLDILEQVRLNVLLISFATAFVAVVALLVAALGIINTMLMTVLERTHEIGVMKAVGARDSHIQSIFLVEGAFIGLVGGGIGLLLSWIASFPGDALARSIIEKQTHSPLEESLFVFPLWLTLGIPLFTALVTTLAAVLPARRAARVSPITALRHE